MTNDVHNNVCGRNGDTNLETNAENFMSSDVDDAAAGVDIVKATA